MEPVSGQVGWREFLLYATTGLGMLGALTVFPLTGATQEDNPVKASKGGPADPSWQIVMVKDDEPGEPLVVSGTIYAADGKTPIDGARLYVYQTDASGRYTRNFLSRKPRLRGWMKTGADGRYEFRTIKPGAYPGRAHPGAHPCHTFRPGPTRKMDRGLSFRRRSPLEAGSHHQSRGAWLVHQHPQAHA